MKVATRELAKFGIIGSINFVIDIGLWNLLVKFAMHDAEVKAKVISTIVATTSAYFMNRHWTFRHRSRSALHREYTLFFLFNGVALAMQAIAVAGAKYGFDIKSLMWLNVVNLLGIAAGTVFRFWSYRRFVWLQPVETAEVAESSTPGSGNHSLAGSAAQATAHDASPARVEPALATHHQTGS